jgi:hypothetical protein
MTLINEEIERGIKMSEQVTKMGLFYRPLSSPADMSVRL